MPASGRLELATEREVDCVMRLPALAAVPAMAHSTANSNHKPDIHQRPGAREAGTFREEWIWLASDTNEAPLDAHGHQPGNSTGRILTRINIVSKRYSFSLRRVGSRAVLARLSSHSTLPFFVTGRSCGLWSGSGVAKEAAKLKPQPIASTGCDRRRSAGPGRGGRACPGSSGEWLRPGRTSSGVGRHRGPYSGST